MTRVSLGGIRRIARTQENPETEHPVHVQLRELLGDGLTPNEAHGVVALISSMRRNGNIMLKTEALEGTERVTVYEEDEGWTRTIWWIQRTCSKNMKSGR